MKLKIISLTVVLLIINIETIHFSQQFISANDQNDIETMYRTYSNVELNFDQLQAKYPIHIINGGTYVSFVAKTKPQFNKHSLMDLGCIVNTTINQLATIKVPIEKIDLIQEFHDLQYLSLSKKMSNSMDKALKDIGADSVHMGLGGLPQAFHGTNVIIGVTDWGFDYTSPVFYDTALEQTRIIAAWDQYKLSGPSPENFNYGTEFPDANSLVNAGSDTANIYSYSTHGTHVASIAGGSGAGTNYRGVAPGVNFLFVTFLVDEGAVLDAWEWMYQKSLEEGKRLVINMSWGLYHAGTLDGNSILSSAISTYTDLGVVFVNSGGNNGDVNFHLKHDFSNDTIKTRVNFYSYSAHQYMWGQSIHAWSEPGKSFSNKISILNSSGNLVTESPFYSTLNTNEYVDTFLIEGADTIWYNISADAQHPLNGRGQMRLRVKCINPSYKVMLHSTAESGLVHYWNVTELSNDVGNWGMPFSTYQSGSIGGDNENGISEPSCADDVISVAAYSSASATPSGTPIGGGIAYFSSRGPRYDGVMKPDISAPGVSVASAISSYTDAQYNSIGSIEFNNRSYHFARLSGTSMAAPMVSGVAALILDAHPTISASAVKEVILETAREDNKTGALPENGDPTWGHGKVNALAAVQRAVFLNQIESIEAPIQIKVYPNPVENILHLDASYEIERINLKNLSGKNYGIRRIGNIIDCGQLEAGIYFLEFETSNKRYIIPFIKK